MKELIKGLVQDIYTHYSVQQSYDEDPIAYEGIQNIIDLKIKQFTSNSLPDNYYSLLRFLQDTFKDRLINNQLYSNFPSYSITIELRNELRDEIKTLTWLNIRISLLTNYYTIYFEERNHFSGFKIRGDKDIPVLFCILSSKNLNVDSGNLYVAKVQELLLNLFPGYQYINHSLLLNYKIPDRIPIGYVDPIPNFYPIYAFLFDNWVDLPTTTVVD